MILWHKEVKLYIWKYAQGCIFLIGWNRQGVWGPHGQRPCTARSSCIGVGFLCWLWACSSFSGLGGATEDCKQGCPSVIAVFWGLWNWRMCICAQKSGGRRGGEGSEHLPLVGTKNIKVMGLCIFWPLKNGIFSKLPPHHITLVKYFISTGKYLQQWFFFLWF